MLNWEVISVGSHNQIEHTNTLTGLKVRFWNAKPKSKPVPVAARPKVKVKTALSGLYDTDARRHIVPLPLTKFTPSSPEALHTK
jgi:hypothetical protein